jgi:hypothetical protein
MRSRLLSACCNAQQLLLASRIRRKALRRITGTRICALLRDRVAK